IPPLVHGRVDHGSSRDGRLEESITWNSRFPPFSIWGYIAGLAEMGPMRWMFDDCVLDLERRELRRAGAPVAVEPQVFDLLVYLIGDRARVGSRDDVVAAVGQGRLVSESALPTRISAARAASGDTGELQTLIRTLPKGRARVETPVTV